MELGESGYSLRPSRRVAASTQLGASGPRRRCFSHTDHHYDKKLKRESAQIHPRWNSRTRDTSGNEYGGRFDVWKRPH
jgi:hypothetical protein